MKLVTGGCGFIGSHFVDALVARGDPVRVIDNLSSGRRLFLTPHLKAKRAEFLRADIHKAAELEKAMRDVDEVFHVAADPDARLAAVKPQLQFRDGAQMTFRVLEAMRKRDARRIVFTSSSVVYGEPDVLPTPESYGPCLPISTYGGSKLAAEAFIASYAGTYGFQAWLFRFANVVGPRMSHGVLYDFKAKLDRDSKRLEILGDGRQEKSYLSTEDCVQGVLFAHKHSRAAVNVFNLATDQATSVTRIAEILVETMGLRGVRFDYTGGQRGWPGDVRKMRLSIDRVKALGWTPRHTSDEAVRRAAEWIARES